MRLPEAELALVEREKVLGYLLNRAHRYGASKARFFSEFGFTAEAWESWRRLCVCTGKPTRLRRQERPPSAPALKSRAN